jgi:hypothetical protein
VSSPNTEDEWRSHQDAFAAALAAFEEAGNGYRGSDAAADVVKQLAPYHDPDRHRAMVIQRFAADLSDEIKAFDQTLTGLTAEAGLLGVRSSQALMSLSVKMLEAGMDTVKLRPDASEMDPRAVRARLKEALPRLEELRKTGFDVVSEMTAALTVGALLVDARQTALEQYLGRVPRIEAGSLASRLIEAVANEGGVQFTAETAARLAGVVPVANIVSAIVNIGKDMREKVSALTAHYERGPLDSMFDFAQQIYDEEQILESVKALLAEIEAFFGAVEANPETSVIGGGGRAVTKPNPST